MGFFEPVASRRLLAPQMIWFLGWFAVTVIGLWLHPSRYGHGTHEQLGLPACPSVLFFDRPCPGCGMTTSWTACIHGQFATAFHAHPLGPISYFVYTISALAGLVGFFRRQRMITDTPKVNWALMGFAAVYLVFGIARMIMTPGGYGAPGETIVVRHH